uniref:Uncharacterized protein n=1 Tax=Aplanochytrium stocchinoi TaxID=215587 RepID=A0A7S3PKP8_9STRA|mmetsp:Transcript_22752/g.29032  ORF Transcript_22752/g.29032 Transcript_22752/m.29032 type:complete len:372 (+) Transcript_22752:117-1232(+)
MVSLQYFLVLITSFFAKVQLVSGQGVTFNMEAVFNVDAAIESCNSSWAICMECAQGKKVECERPICTRDETFQLYCETTVVRCNLGCFRTETVEVPVSTGPLKFEFVTIEQTELTTESQCNTEYNACVKETCEAEYKTCAPCRPEFCKRDDEQGIVYADNLQIFDMHQNLGKCKTDESWCYPRQYESGPTVDIRNFERTALFARIDFLGGDFGAIVQVINELNSYKVGSVLDLYYQSFWYDTYCDSYPSTSWYSDCDLKAGTTDCKMYFESGSGGTGEVCKYECGQSEKNCLYNTLGIGGSGDPTNSDYPICNECPHKCTYYQDYSDKVSLKPRARFGTVRGEVEGNCFWYDDTYYECLQAQYQCISDYSA